VVLRDLELAKTIFDVILFLLKISGWQWLDLFYFLELRFNTVSVSVMKRHLMMWSTFASYFIFTSVLFLTFIITWFYGILNWPKPFFDVILLNS